MALELFSRRRTTYIDPEPKVTVGKTSQFRLNISCTKKYFANKRFVQLYYDQKEGLIGIKPLGRQTNDTFNLRRVTHGKVGIVSAKGFLKFLGIQFSECKRFTPNWNRKESMLVIKIK